MILAIGYHSPVEFYQQLDQRELPHPGDDVAVLSSMAELSRVGAARHIIIFDTPFVLCKIKTAYWFDFAIAARNPLRLRPKSPLWGILRSFRVQPTLGIAINSEINVTQQIIDQQRANDVIDKINRLKKFLTSDRMDRIIVAYANFLKTGDLDSLRLEFEKIIARNKQKEACAPIIDSILKWSVTPPAIRLIAAMREVGDDWRKTYEKISARRGIRPFELSFFLVAHERSSNV